MPKIKPPKGILSVLLASKMKPSKKGPEEMMDENEEEMEKGDLDIAAEEVISALDSRDPQALAESLKAFIEMC